MAYGSPTLARAPVAQRTAVLHVATSRAAAVRLAPVADALTGRVGQGVLAPTLQPREALPPARSLMTLVAGELPAGTPGSVAATVEAAIDRARPELVFLSGEGDAAVAAALVAGRLGVRIARLGAGLRCGDRTVGEEIDRIVLDAVADRLYADGEGAVMHLLAEGIPRRRIRCVGSTLADVVARRRPAAAARAAWRDLGLPAGGYVLTTLHRPENVDDDLQLARTTEALCELVARTPVVLCVHARTRTQMEASGDIIRLRTAGVAVLGALPYVDFLSLQVGAGAVLTDSAAVQEETTLLGVACFTLRRATERALTLIHGSNVLLGDDPAEIRDVALGPPAEPVEPIPLWDGAAGRRIADDLLARRLGEAA
jgi:UDP-N-acetylglucosamine 2-epimerase (non-hydrolysing)